MHLRLAVLAAGTGVLLASTCGMAGEEDDGQEYTGTVACAHCNHKDATKVDKCAAAIKVGEHVYLLEASDKADEDTRNKIANYKKDLKGDFVVVGKIVEADGKKKLVADLISPVKKE